MRPYRGLTKDGKWVYGYYVKCRGDHYILSLHDPDNPESSFDERWIQEGADEDGWIKVIPETVGQQTGKQDSNSTEIYEDDITEFYNACVKKGTNPMCREVAKWHKGHAGFIGCFNGGKIIGNIHQNPKLMGEARK